VEKRWALKKSVLRYFAPHASVDSSSTIWMMNFTGKQAQTAQKTKRCGLAHSPMYPITKNNNV